MAIKKEILLYGALYPWSAEYLVREISTFDDKDNITMRINTPGGYVNQGRALLSRLSDREGKVQMYVDAEAASMGAFMLLYGEGNIAAEDAKIRFHKADFPPYYEASQEERAELKEMNDQYRAKMEKRLNGSAKAIALIAKVFEPDVRNTVTLSAQDGLDIGLISEIRVIDLGAKERIAAQMSEAVAAYNLSDLIEAGTPAPKNNNEVKPKEKKTMTIDQLKAEHPALFAQVIAQGHEQGAAAERDRVGSFMAFFEADPKAVKVGIESGKAMTDTQRSEFAIAAYKAIANAQQTEGNTPEVKPRVPATPQASNAEAEIDAALASSKHFKAQ